MKLSYKALTPFILGLLIAFFPACSMDSSSPLTQDKPNSSELAQVQQESRCGYAWDLQNIEYYNGTYGLSTSRASYTRRSVGAVFRRSSDSKSFCSGTMIDGDLFLSAAHCNIAVGNYIALNHQYNRNTGQLHQRTSYRVVQVIEKSKGGLDYMVVRITGWHSYRSMRKSTVSAGTKISLIHHPAGIPKVISGGSVTRTGVRLSGRSGRYIGHTADTSGGSSGSSVFNMNGQIIAVHTNAGCTNTGGANHALPISEIAKYSSLIRNMTR